MSFDGFSAIIGMLFGMGIMPIFYLISKKELPKKQFLLISLFCYLLAFLVQYLVKYT